MSLIRIFTFLQSLGAKPMDAALLIITGALSFFLLKKADKKEMEFALEKKADKDAVADLKEFIDTRFNNFDTRFEDIKTYFIELSKK